MALEDGVAALAVASGAAAVTYTILNLAQNRTILFQPKMYMAAHLIYLNILYLNMGLKQTL